MQTRKIPATIVTGFLGSGKTTLLRHVLEQAGGLRVAVIVNEFGELGIDGELLKTCAIGCAEEGRTEAAIYELANGCMCCTVQEEFFPAMQALVQRRDDIDVLLIETSGLALPKPLVQAFQWSEIANAFTVDSVITVVDAPAAAAGQFAHDPHAVDEQRQADPNLDHDASLHELFEDQLSAADMVLLSKVDQLKAGELEAVKTLVAAEIPPQVQMLEVEQGRLPLSVLLGQGRASEAHIDAKHSHHDHEEDHEHDAFDSLVLDFGVCDLARLRQALEAITTQQAVLRIKGFVAVQDKAMRYVLQGVGRRLDGYFDRPWAAQEAKQSRLVFIGRDLNEAVLRAQLQSSQV